MQFGYKATKLVTSFVGCFKHDKIFHEIAKIRCTWVLRTREVPDSDLDPETGRRFSVIFLLSLQTMS